MKTDRCKFINYFVCFQSHGSHSSNLQGRHLLLQCFLSKYINHYNYIQCFNNIHKIFSCTVVSINTVASWACLPCKATLILKINNPKIRTRSIHCTSLMCMSLPKAKTTNNTSMASGSF
jgi:hypothetical protein